MNLRGTCSSSEPVAADGVAGALEAKAAKPHRATPSDQRNGRLDIQDPFFISVNNEASAPAEARHTFWRGDSSSSPRRPSLSASVSPGSPTGRTLTIPQNVTAIQHGRSGIARILAGRPLPHAHAEGSNGPDGDMHHGESTQGDDVRRC